jgi:hypothetical protein
LIGNVPLLVKLSAALGVMFTSHCHMLTASARSRLLSAVATASLALTTR